MLDFVLARREAAQQVVNGTRNGRCAVSASNEWQEYHLTPTGWVEGSEKIDFVGVREAPIPAHRVLTVRSVEYMSSGFSPLRSYWEETWRSDDSSAVQKLVAKFGERPGA
jgi:hypothetical protein